MLHSNFSAKSKPPFALICSLLVVPMVSLLFLFPEAALATKAMDKFELGNALLSKGSAKSAVFFYDKCIKLNPSFYPAYVKRGDAMKMLGKTSWAKEDYRYALKINPRCTEAKKKLSALSGSRSKASNKKRANYAKSTAKTTNTKNNNDTGGLSRLSRSHTKSEKQIAPPTSD